MVQKLGPVRVAVEKLGFPEKSRKSGDRKCLREVGKSFVELPDAKQFLRILAERVFQQPQDLSTVIGDALEGGDSTCPVSALIRTWTLFSCPVEKAASVAPVNRKAEDVEYFATQVFSSR